MKSQGSWGRIDSGHNIAAFGSGFPEHSNIVSLKQMAGAWKTAAKIKLKLRRNRV